MKPVHLALTAVLAASIGAGGAALFQPQATYQVRYSPSGGCTEMAVVAIDAARKEIRIWSYSFTSKPIADAWVRAHQRGVDVQLVIDGPAAVAHDSLAGELRAAGIPVFLDHKHKIMHMKVQVIDGKTLLVGSFNWTAAAESGNAESLLEISDSALCKQYLANWAIHQAHSDPWKK